MARYYCYYYLIALCTWPEQHYNLLIQKYDQNHNIIQQVLDVYAKDILLLYDLG